MTLFSRASRGERLPLLELFLLIIVVFSWVTFYVALRQGDIHIAESALPILHSIRAEIDHLEKDVIGGVVPPKEGPKATQDRPAELIEVKSVVSTEVQADVSTGLNVAVSIGINAEVSTEIKPDPVVSTGIKEDVTTAVQPTPASKAQINGGEIVHRKMDHKLAGLNCDAHGGPSNDLAQEMVYWEDIPSDSKFQSKFKRPGQYMTFESDHGGWNNVRF